jgi:hypothetical protein
MWALVRHKDRLTEACNKVALLLVGNTPFYPLYLWFILGRAGWPWLLLSALSLPFFAATIWVARRNGLAGRVWLCACASINTAWVTWLLGPPAGVALFFLPCLVLAVLSFRATELLARALLTALPFALYLGLIWMPHFPTTITPAAFASLFKLNAISVALLSVVLPYVLGAARGEGYLDEEDLR